MRSSEDHRLSSYVKKRNPDRTPEPFSGVVVPGGSLFVVHQHAASHDHFDLRLEIEGVLWSWAVPKGPSPNPKDKRLAIAVEQHPLDYVNFEGIIPEGNYGAGAMIVWDRGRWHSRGDPVAGFEKGKLLFDLHGFKLHGRWTLVKTRGGPNHWLLIKERDGWVNEAGSEAYCNDSVLSGLTVETLAKPLAAQSVARRTLKRLGGVEKPVQAARIRPMLCTRSQPFSNKEWLFEVKYDGYRAIAAKQGSTPILRSRNGQNLAPAFPEVVAALSWLPVEQFVMDGELVIHDATGRPDFNLLQQRAQLKQDFAVLRASRKLPAALYLFDLLAYSDLDVRGLPLLHRKSWLRRLLPSAGTLRYADHVVGEGEALFEHAGKMRLEGIVGKLKSSPYESRRSENWIKIPALKTADFVVIGYRRVKLGEGLGSVHVARFKGLELVYRGRVGTGFDSNLATTIQTQLDERRARRPACEVADASARDVWCRPELVCEASYKNLTRAGRLRQPVFNSLRPDLTPDDCNDDSESIDLADEVKGAPSATPEVGITNPDKVFWPDDGYTKADLVAYYVAISRWMLPYLERRPLVLTRYPDGIEGKNFFQKDAPAFIPEWLDRAQIYSESGDRTIRYLVANSAEALAYIANMGAIPLHLWSSCVDNLDRPDYSIIDLDPKEAPFSAVVELALAIHELCEELGLPNYVKTSGASGLHVLIPLARQLNYEQSRMVAELIARVILKQYREIGTVVRAVERRDRKVYLDCLQNGYGKTIVAPFAVRPLPGAPVSMPLRWREVRPSLDVTRYNIRSAPRRMRSLNEDPMQDMLSCQPDLLAALDRLRQRL